MTSPSQIIDEPIRSDQRGIHPDLTAVVQKHAHSAWRKPIPDHTRRAADEAIAWLEALGSPPLILDSFCGTGMSTAALATQHEDCAVLGVDKSRDRLSRHMQQAGCYRLLRAECEPLWRCLVDAGITLRAHYLLFPNPWPKAAHLKRRIHGHPGFPWLIKLGGQIECRSNWRLYIEEFSAACRLMNTPGLTEQYQPARPLTLFEQKYQERGQALWHFQSARSAE